jgi:hypothetical protein
MKLPFRDKAIVNVKACFPTDKSFLKSIELCSFEPDSANWRIWEDEFGYTITITDEKKLRLQNNNCPIKVRDLYYKAPKSWAIENNQWSRLEENIEWYLGNDNKLRLFRYIDNNWVRSSTLSLKWAALKDVISEILEE